VAARRRRAAYATPIEVAPDSDAAGQQEAELHDEPLQFESRAAPLTAEQRDEDLAERVERVMDVPSSRE